MRNGIYYAALFVTLLRVSWLGYWSRFPAFCVFLGLQTLAASVWLAADDYDRLATTYAWTPVEMLSVIAAALAGAEIIGKAERAGVRTGLQQFVASFFAVVVAARSGAGIFFAVREATWIWLALVLIGALVFAWLKPIPLDPILHHHASLLAALMGAHAFIAPILRWGGAPTWISANLAYRAVAIICCIGWCYRSSSASMRRSTLVNRAS